MKKEIVPLSDQARAVLLGALLGDGSLTKSKGYANVRFQMRHSEKQAEYFFWKASALKEIAAPISVFRQKGDGYGKNEKLRFSSKALPILTELHKLTYKNNKLQIRRKWLNQMTALSLAIWWCDDGSLISNSRKGVICTDGFNEKSVKILSQYLSSVWKIRNVVAPVRRKRDGREDEYWRIWIRSTEELKKFLKIIVPYIPVEKMLSKVLLIYDDYQLQQRWISEVSQLSKFSQEIVKKQLELKKDKWKRYKPENDIVQSS